MAVHCALLSTAVGEKAWGLWVLGPGYCPGSCKCLEESHMCLDRYLLCVAQAENSDSDKFRLSGWEMGVEAGGSAGRMGENVAHHAREK